jgi:hypothetical protein
MRPAIVGAIAVLMAIGAGAYWFTRRNERTAKPSSSSTTIADAAPALRHEPAPSASLDDAGLLPEAAVVRDKTVAASREAFRTLERRFEGQERDDAWAGPKRDAIADSFRAAKLDAVAELRDVDCKRTLCVATIVYKSSANLDDDVAAVMQRWLLGLSPCLIHAPAPLLLTPPPSGGGPEARIFIECPRS